MPLFHFKRPLFLCLLSYVGLILLLSQWGFWGDISSRRFQSSPQEIRESNLLFSWAGRCRRSLLKLFGEKLDPEKAAVLSGILLGIKSDLSPELRKAFADSGAMHLLVASGTNVASVFFIAYWLLRRLFLSRRKSTVAAALAAGFYVLVAGADPPLVRAYLMTCASILGYLLARDSGAFQGLVLAAWVLLLADPLTLFQAGFQMSFMACLGIIAAMPNWQAASKNPWVRHPLNLFFTSLAAQSALIPLLVGYFRKFSLIGIVSNMLLVPMAALVMASGALMALTALLPFPPAAFMVQQAAGFLLEIFIRCVLLFSQAPFAVVELNAWTPWHTLAYYGLLPLFWQFKTESVGKFPAKKSNGK